MMVGGARRWGWREPIRLVDDSPGLSIYSNRREGEGVWEGSRRTASLHRRQGVSKGGERRDESWKLVGEGMNERQHNGKMGRG